MSICSQSSRAMVSTPRSCPERGDVSRGHSGRRRVPGSTPRSKVQSPQSQVRFKGRSTSIETAFQWRPCLRIARRIDRSTLNAASTACTSFGAPQVLAPPGGSQRSRLLGLTQRRGAMCRFQHQLQRDRPSSPWIAGQRCRPARFLRWRDGTGTPGISGNTLAFGAMTRGAKLNRKPLRVVCFCHPHWRQVPRPQSRVGMMSSCLRCLPPACFRLPPCPGSWEALFRSQTSAFRWGRRAKHRSI